MDEEEHTLRDDFAAWLRDQGHEPRVDILEPPRFATVWFKTRGRQYAIRVDEDDRAFCHVQVQYDLPAWLDDELGALRLAARVQAEIKAVKVSLGWEGRTVLFEVEQYLFAPACLDGVLWRSVGALDSGSEKFWALANESRPAPVERFIRELERELGHAPGESR